MAAGVTHSLFSILARNLLSGAEVLSSSPTAAKRRRLSIYKLSSVITDNVYESICGENSYSCSLPQSDSDYMHITRLLTMSMNLFVGRIHIHVHCLNQIRTTCTSLASSSTQATPPNPNPPPAFAVQYLVQSCGLSSEKALKASKYVQHLKSFDKADAVPRFLREIGISESDIKTAVSREPRILCSQVEKTLRPNISKLQKLGFSIKDISCFIARNPNNFRANFVQKIDFFIGVLGSVENISVILKAPWNDLLHRSLERVFMPNLCFLHEQCGLSPRQITQLMIAAPRLISSRPDVFKMEVERAEKLGVARSSTNFLNALFTVSYQKQPTIDARLSNLTTMGLSQDEVALMISKAPSVLRIPEKLVCNKMEYLIKEAGCDKIDVLQNPALLTYSLENRLIPRTIVRKLLMSKGLPVANKKFASFMKPSEEEFLKKFVLPYEHAIPGLHRAYADASTGKIGGTVE